jgi:hypothetical protein
MWVGLLHDQCSIYLNTVFCVANLLFPVICHLFLCRIMIRNCSRAIFGVSPKHFHRLYSTHNIHFWDISTHFKEETSSNLVQKVFRRKAIVQDLTLLPPTLILPFPENAPPPPKLTLANQKFTFPHKIDIFALCSVLNNI